MEAGLMKAIPNKVLVVTPHPDDAEIWCGGTIASWIKQGADVCYLLCTNGSRGTEDTDITPQELAEIREQEQLNAASVLGVRDVVMLHRNDGELEDTTDFRRDIVEQIRKVRPDVVLSTEPYRFDLSWHRDHRITGQVALDAVFPYARDHLHFGELWSEQGLEPHKTGTMLFWGTERPDTFIDITKVMDTKIKSVMSHNSQMSGRTEEEISDLLVSRAEEVGKINNNILSEAFRKVTFRT
ncbi:MAG: PIG-L domain-containing protein [Dehalococcoidia bacterium]|nr:PIG-L domain-containing protein [Dehalococcoidia bacterium]